MDLISRIHVTDKGFKLMPPEEEGREAFYGLFTLKDDPNVVPGLSGVAYWDLKNGFEQEIRKPESFVYLEERVGGKVVETSRFFYSKNKRKGSLAYNIEKKRKYGPDAFLITITWNSAPEPIHRTYVSLMDTRKNKFPFITDVIGKDGSGEDQYVFHAPDGDAPEDYRLVFSDLLRQKYVISE